MREAEDRLDRVLAFGRALRRRIVVVAKTVAPMKPLRLLQRPDKRGPSAHVDRHGRTADVRGEERVPRRLLEAHVAGDGRQRQNAHVGGGERHDDRDRVVGGGVGVDEEIAHDGTPLSKRNLSILAVAENS